MEKLTLEITGMSCGHCVAAVKKALSVDGVVVDEVVVGRADVRVDPAMATAASLAERVADAGFAVTGTH